MNADIILSGHCLLSLLAKMGNSQSTFFRPISYTCYELGHTWNPSCTQSSVEVGLTCFEEALKIYASVYTVRVALLSLKWQGFVVIASKCCFSSFPWCWGADFLIKRPWWPCWKTFSDLQPSYLTMLSTLSGPFALSGKHDRNNLLLRYTMVVLIVFIYRQKARNTTFLLHYNTNV